MFYVENQSLALDLAILLATVRTVVASCLKAVRRRRTTPAAAPASLLPPTAPDDDDLGLLAS